MLDERFEPLEELDGADTDIYTFGRIGKHCVVIACPGPAYGWLSASNRGRDMMHKFKSLQVVLMVGIGGGIPSAANDIRLGDVVISYPTGTRGCVLQYDMSEDGKFSCTEFLKRPPRLLLTAVNRMRAAAFQKDLCYPTYIQQALQRNTQMLRDFDRPGSQYDRLFQIQYEHPPTATTCDECSTEWEVVRDEREDHVSQPHYGIIISANVAIKNGEIREQLQKDTEALCLEMDDTTVLMHDFPCIVIRGICDYADSHKYRQWQGYAALAAASYTKELLQYIPHDQLS
ncbi:hypothetical protein EMPG_12516 [Blastomyces silverae]|uniref:Uncharacterized protein n=1 Tax=Blastomyces silverae TaxID=2060906 RepID=A0A0H1BLQ5_9EURO|nr:hypothetical protein EMPG_12516 [Blastomyces silverae]